MRHFLFIFLLLPFIGLTQTDTLQVAVYDKAPFGMQESGGEFTGLMVELWEDIAKDLNVSYKYKLVKMDELIDGLNRKEYDIGLGAISVTPERESKVDFTQPVNPSGTTVGFSKKYNQVGFFQKWTPILWSLLELLIALFLMLLIAAIIVWLVDRKRAKRKGNATKSIADGLWSSVITMTTIGYGDKASESNIGKIIGIIWIFTSIIFFSLFTANASAKLAVMNKIKANFNSVEDLRKAKVITVGESSGEAFLKRERINYSKATNLSKAIEQVLDGKAQAIVYNAPVLKHYNKTYYHNDLIVNNNYLLKNNMAIALQPNSDLEEKINLLLLDKISEPKWQASMFKYIGD